MCREAGAAPPPSKWNVRPMGSLEKRISVTAGAVVALLVTIGCGRPPHGSAGWRITPDRSEDRVAARNEGGRARIDVSSPRGIGSASIRILAAERPREIVLRFHLRGLEELRFEYDSTAVVVSLPTGAPGTVIEEVRIPGRPARRLAGGGPHWMAVQPRHADGSPAERPQPDGWIEVHVPEDFVNGNADAFRIVWVDFYR